MIRRQMLHPMRQKTGRK